MPRLSRREASDHGKRLLDLSSEFMCVVRRDGTMAMRNTAFERMLGYGPREFESLSFFELFQPDDQDVVLPRDDQVGDGTPPVGVGGTMRCADGTHRKVTWSLCLAPGSAIYAIGRETDEPGSTATLTAEIEQLHIASDALADMRNNLDICMTLQEASQVIQRFCLETMKSWPGEVWFINSSRNLMERITKWGEGDGGDPMLVATMDPSDCWALRGGRPHAFDPKTSGLACKHFQVEPTASLCIPLKGAAEVFGLLTTWGSPVNGDANWGSYLERTTTVAEVLAMGLANLTLRESLRSQSIRDPLTSLFNRRFMEESFDRELARATRHESTVGLIVFDIDNFKQFNDNFGHRAGDTVLIRVGALLREIIRSEDVACRYGGEEFAVIMPGAPLEVTMRRATAIGDAIKEITIRDDSGGILGDITVSLGVSQFPEHGTTHEALIKAADLALFMAKRSGRDCLRIATRAPEDGGSEPDRPA